MSYLYRLVTMDIHDSKKMLSDKYTERTKTGSKEANGKTPIDFTRVKISDIVCSAALCFRMLKKDLFHPTVL